MDTLNLAIGWDWQIIRKKILAERKYQIGNRTLTDILLPEAMQKSPLKILSTTHTPSKQIFLLQQTQRSITWNLLADRLNPNKMINTYKLYSTSQLASVKKHSRVTIWCSKNSDPHTAEVIVISDLEEQTQEGTITFGAEDSHRLTGYLTKTGDGQCTINKIDSYELKDGSTVSSSTSLEIPMHYEEDIPITIRDVYENEIS